jgi:GNAT superfamily N-acetyltransferase
LLFVKNRLPVGYGILECIPASAIPDANAIGFHIFEEYRGTVASHRFFEAFVQAAERYRAPRHLLIYLNSQLAWEEVLQEDADGQRPALDFYLRHGFAPGEIEGNPELPCLVKEVGPAA